MPSSTTSLHELERGAARHDGRLRAAEVRQHPRRVGLGRARGAGAADARCGSTPPTTRTWRSSSAAMGHGYQARMNVVLRAYMLAILEPGDRQPEERGLDGAGDLRRACQRLTTV